MKNNGLFSVNVRRQKTIDELPHQEQRFTKCENIYNHPLSRARVRTHHRSFCIFAVTSVTASIIMYYISNHCVLPWIYINNYSI